MSNVIKNTKRIFTGGQGDPSLGSRVQILENNEIKITYFQAINASSGTITIPTGATILLDQFQSGVDAYVSTISNAQPTGIFPKTALGVTVDVTSFDALGNYTLSGTPSAYPVALIYILKIDAKDYYNLVLANILDEDEISNIINGQIAFGDGNNALVGDVNFTFVPNDGLGNTKFLVGRPVNTNYLGILFHTATSTIEGQIAIARNAGTGMFTGAGANSLNIASNGNNVNIGDITADKIGITVFPGASPTARVLISGPIKIVDGTQAATYVLTSDAAGLASWQPPSSSGSFNYPQVLFTQIFS